MTAASALGLLDALRQVEVEACVGGGWAVDALVGGRRGSTPTWTSGCKPSTSTLPWGGDRPRNLVLHDGS